MLCAVRGMGRTLDFALKEAQQTQRPLYLLFVREQTVITAEDRRRKWVSDEEAGDDFPLRQGERGRQGDGAAVLRGERLGGGDHRGRGGDGGRVAVDPGRAEPQFGRSTCCAATSCGR